MSQGSPIRNRTLRREFITTLPSEIIINILIRLPIRAILCCKCVCKSFLHLIETHEFANSHLSMSVPVLAICHEKSQSNQYRIFEIEDRFDLEHLELFRNPVTRFDLPYRGWIHGSANGFLLLHDRNHEPEALCIFNPITRDCIKLCCPPEFVGSCSQRVTSGFGASKITGQLKVVRICQGYMPNKSECHVYTLGTRSWRRIEPGAYLEYGCDNSVTFLNGNLHWLAFDSNGSPLISCFDLELELFSTFSTPSLSHEMHMENMIALGDCLCFYDNKSTDALVIWLMKEYGVESSWTKEIFISVSAFTGEGYGIPFRINAFKDGNILIGWDCSTLYLFYYSKKNSATQKIDMFEPRSFIDAIIYTPSFLSLKSFRRENVSTF